MVYFLYYKRKCYILQTIALLFLLIFCPLFIGCHREKTKPDSSVYYNDELEALKWEANRAAENRDFNRSDSLGKLLYLKAVDADNDLYKALGLAYQSFYNDKSEEVTMRLNNLKRAEKFAQIVGDNTVLAFIYNMLGIFSSLAYQDVGTAKNYYKKALEYTKLAENDKYAKYIQFNLSELYHSIHDTLALDYDLELLKYAEETENLYMIEGTAIHIARYFLMQPQYIDKSLPYIEKIGIDGNLYDEHLMRSEYYLLVDSLDLAEKELVKAMNVNSKSHPGVYEGLGLYYNKTGKYDLSNENLQKALDLHKNFEVNNPNQNWIYRMMAENYYNKGDYKNSAIFLSKYSYLADSIFKAQKNEEIQKFKIRYEVEKKENQLLALKSTNRIKDLIIFFGGLLFLSFIIFIVLYNRRKISLHRLIAIQNRDFATRLKSASSNMSDKVSQTQSENLIDEVILSEKTDNNLSSSDNSKYIIPGLSKERADSIWDKIEELMNKDEIWRSLTSTRDTFAEMVGCNHTWVTAVIKEYTGLSYLQFMNNRRLEEAVAIISNSHDKTPLKDIAINVGFSSLSTFYAAFKAKMDMSPSEFRKHVNSSSSSNS